MSVSTHVLDAAAGTPARELLVTLERRVGDAWLPLAAARTDHEGRIRRFPVRAAVPPGVLRLTFHVEPHFGAGCFHPEVVVVFRMADGDEHLHVPLLLSPYAFSTYRGT